MGLLGSGSAAIGASQDQLTSARDQDRDSQIRSTSELRKRPFLRVTLDLTTARAAGDAFLVSEPFDGFRVESATDSTTEIRLSAVSNEQHQMINYLSLKQNDSGNFGEVQRSARLTWTAQSGKSVTVIFFLGFEFRSGSQLSVNSGGVSINDGSASSTAAVTLAAATATQILALDTNRKVGTFENESGADMWVSGSSSVSNTGANKGIVVHAGGKVNWRNTAALYGYSVAGTTLTVMAES